MEPMDKEEDQLQQQMAETRASLTEKLETLEQKVVGTVEEATTAVAETVDVIKESVQGTVAAVNETVKGTVTSVNETVKESVETVKDWFDISAHVREHPWAVVGGSVAVGFCLGNVIGKNTRSGAASFPGSGSSYRSENYRNGGVREETPSPAFTLTPAPAPASASSTAKSLLSNSQPEIDKLKGLALGVLFGTVREMIASSVSQSVSGHVGEQLKEVFDSVTKKMGGEPIPSSELGPKPQDETEGAWQGQRGRETAPAESRRW